MTDPSPVVLHTDRLVLRPRRVAEAGVYRQLWVERDPRVPAHRRLDAAGRPSVADLADGVRRELEDPRPGLLSVALRDGGEVIGCCGLVFHGTGAPDEPELAFELLREFQGRGHATEAAGAVVAWASRCGYGRLWATVRVWNHASRRVLEKLGFAETGRVEADADHGDNLLTVLLLAGR